MRLANPPALAAALTLATLTLPGPAAAQSEDPRRCSREEPFNCLNGVGASVTSLDSLRVSGTRVTRRSPAEEEAEEQTRTARLGPLGARRGLAAGEGLLGGWTVWGSYAFADFEADLAVAPYEANAHNLLGGLDRSFLDGRLVAGLSLGFERTDTDTLFNGGEQQRDGVTVAVYAAYLLNDVFSVDVGAGYTRLDTDQDRIDPANAATLRSSFDADRGFVTANLNAVRAFGNLVLGARVGALHTGERQDGYTETGGPSVRTVRTRHVDLTQLYAGVDVGYSAGAFEPYAIAIYRNDAGRDDGSGAGGLPSAVGATQPADDDEWQLGLGVRYFGASGITGSLEWLRTEGRDRFDEDAFTLTVRVPL